MFLSMDFGGSLLSLQFWVLAKTAKSAYFDDFDRKAKTQNFGVQNPGVCNVFFGGPSLS